MNSPAAPVAPPPPPNRFTLVAGAAEGTSELNAFDHALLAAGVGNVNLVKVSSILPPGARFASDLKLPQGALVPIAYGAMVGEERGELVAAAVAVGINRESGFGVIMEYSGHAAREVAEAEVRRRVEEAFRTRGLRLDEVMARAVSHRVERRGCAFAGVPLWYG